MRPLVAVTRVVEFSASHRLHSPRLGEGANRAVFGKCNNPNGHGHTYRLEATVRGPLDPETGLVPATPRLDAALAEVVLARFDGANLNRDIAELEGTSRTSEELARLLARLLATAIGPAFVRLALHETPNNVFEVDASGLPGGTIP
jgi:6-pyruvoyltetrahydropterin/6-carboxytetrahydropterin synthase